jgi:hypothetical protein
VAIDTLIGLGARTRWFAGTRASPIGTPRIGLIRAALSNWIVAWSLH